MIAWVAMFVLSLLAALFVLWPLFTRRADSGNAHDETVKALYRQRLAEVENETSGVVQQEVQDELGAVLLTELPGDGTSQADGDEDDAAGGVTARSRVRLFLVAAVLPVMGWGLYLAIGDAGVAELRGAEALMSLNPEEHQQQIQDWQHRLQVRVDDAPEDHKSWYLLGHAELKLNNYTAAAQAFASTHALVEDDPTVQVYWLQARYLAANGALDQVSRGLADKLLAQNPNLPVVLEMLAIDAYRDGRTGEAVTLLNRAISGSSDPVQQASFAVAIKQVRATMAQQAPPSGVTVHATTTSKVPRGSTLFVLARPVGGGMPYAVVKRPAALLPLTVQLDDLVSMSPARLLSSAEEFEVVVRLSRTGTAMAAADDWQWVSPVQNGSAKVELQAELVPPTS